MTFFPNGTTAPSDPGPPHYRGFTITLRHTSLGRTPLDEWSARRRDLDLTTQNTHKIQPSMPPARFEPSIQAGERPQTHALETIVSEEIVVLYEALSRIETETPSVRSSTMRIESRLCVCCLLGTYSACLLLTCILVGIVTKLQVGRRSKRCWISSRTKRFVSCPQSVRTSYLAGTHSSYHGGKSATTWSSRHSFICYRG
jgi:hypothetical protein